MSKRKSKIKTFPFDPATYVTSEEGVTSYLEEALATDDPAFIIDALRVVARARGMMGITNTAVLAHVAEVLSDEDDPKFSTVIRVIRSLGLRLSIHT